MKPEATINPDDPRLSAYLLGELPADEMLVFEAQLQRSPEAQAELELMRSAVEMLRQSFEAEWQEGMNAETVPPLSVLPAPEVGKVIDFQNEPTAGGQAGQRRFPSKVAAVSALAAAIALAAFMLPKTSPGGGVSPQTLVNGNSGVTAETHPASTPVAAPAGENGKVSPIADSFSGSDTAAVAPAPFPVPSLGYQDAAMSYSGSGYQNVVSVPGGLALTGDAAPAKARPLGTDPTITAVRFLSDDPVDVSPVPLPAELLSYLPETGAGNQPMKATGGASAHRISARLLGAANVYLDQKKFPDPEIVHRQVELTGGVFQEDGDQTRSLYQTEQRSDASGRTSVIVKGMVRLEAEDRIGPVTEEPDPGYEFEIMPFTQTSSHNGQEIRSLPSGAILKKAEPAMGAPEPSGDIATRYIIRQQDRLRRAAAFAETGRRQLEKGEFGSAASNLELSLEILPDAPATEKLRGQIMSRLEKANAALAE